ncbi:type 2 isopentenyl-diphosphate Delta-isomerase [Sediminibacillus albus]|nr:type 2 isopentenyl-diphosphate Delta-isomerase [Sediminibacillus albus]
MSRANRKLEHIKYALESNKEEVSAFDGMKIIHQSVTSLNWDDIELHTKLGGLSLSSPLFVNAMTGGGGMDTETINKNLAIAAKETGISMSVGSQMSAIKNNEEERTYRVVRSENPNGIIFANLGSEASVEQAQRAVDMIEADALQIHLNVLQELIMPEGDRNFERMESRIEAIVNRLPVPVIIKEIGQGFSKESALRMKNVGVEYIDVAGKGGTNFSIVENRRRKTPLSSFDYWGIPTPASIKEVHSVFPECQLLASGGIRNGLDGAKSLILGAKAFGMAGSLLKVLVNEGLEALVERIEDIHKEVQMIMLMLESKTPDQLAGKPHVFTGELYDWIHQRI